MHVPNKPGCFDTKLHGFVKALLRGRSSIQGRPRDCGQPAMCAAMAGMISLVVMTTMMNSAILLETICPLWVLSQ